MALGYFFFFDNCLNSFLLTRHVACTIIYLVGINYSSDLIRHMALAFEKLIVLFSLSDKKSRLIGEQSNVIFMSINIFPLKNYEAETNLLK